MKRLKRFIIPIFIPNAGCPHMCVFCDQGKITGTKERVNAKNIQTTVKDYLATRPDWNREVELAYFGGSFTSLPMKRQNELLMIGKSLIDEGLIDSIRLSTRPDYISDKILDNLVRHGVGMVEIGVQSMVDEVLDSAMRGHTVKDTRLAVKLLKSRGLPWIAQLMPGLPGDSDETILYSAKRVSELDPDGVRIYPTLVVRDTELNVMYRNGEFIPLTLDKTISLLKEMVAIFDESSIPIIRMGLKPSVELEREIVAGPYHSSLKSRVLESIMFDRLMEAIGALNYIPDTLTIKVNPGRISYAVGNNKINLIGLKERFNLKMIKMVQDDAVEPGEVIIGGI